MAFEYPLLSCQKGNDSHRLESQELFAASIAVMAHGVNGDPLLTYANSAALQLWCRQWDEMVGMPSRLTAPSTERKKRATALNSAIQSNAIKGYQGIRINSKGQLFMISNARIWTLWDENETVYGQAAAFSSWWLI